MTDSAGMTPDVKTVSLPWILAVLLRDRRLIGLMTIAGLVIAVGIGLTKTRTYTSTFSFIPQSSENQGKAGLASLAGQFGISVGALGGSSQPPQLYADLLGTRGVLSVIARESVTVKAQGSKRVALPEFLKIRGSDSAIVFENTLTNLRKEVVTTSVATRTTGVVTVTVRTSAADVSLQIAKRLLESLNRFNLETRRSQAAEERRFTEGRLEAARASLRAAEDALQHFQQANRQPSLPPDLQFQRDRLQREVTLQQQIVTGLAQQYEDARIREVRDTPVITIIEQPALPVLPDSSGRVILIGVLTFFGLFAGCAFVVMRDGWFREQRTAPNDDSYAALRHEWQKARAPRERP